MTQQQIDDLREKYNLVNVKFAEGKAMLIECVKFYSIDTDVEIIMKSEKFGELEYLEHVEKIKVTVKIKC